jgi:3-dehydroquinate synthase
MFDSDFAVASSQGPYVVRFRDNVLGSWKASRPTVALIDEHVLELYGPSFSRDLAALNCVPILAAEETKTLENMPTIVSRLLEAGTRRGSSLLAIGGGITQDIASFLASVMFRGMPWQFIPTTLLAQADSCIGSKSSINASGVKNLLGTFHPPDAIDVDCSVLATLDKTALHSGIGEMLKVHAISGPRDFDRLAENYESLLSDSNVMTKAVHQSLLYKKRLVELDEFDEGPRNVMNYGHSFGHAIETATEYAIPHGVAVSIGMDMANYVAQFLGVTTLTEFERMHPVLRLNSMDFDPVLFEATAVISALQRDKKNSSTHYRLVLPDTNGEITLSWIDMDEQLVVAVSSYLATARLA